VAIFSSIPVNWFLSTKYIDTINKGGKKSKDPERSQDNAIG
jgi:hypothetical protein